MLDSSHPSSAKRTFYVPEAKIHVVTEEDLPPMPRRLLLLEDDPDLTRLLTDFLAAEGFEVVCVKNGVEGLKHIMADDFDIVLCDMVMPHLPGDMFYVAVERVRPHICKRFVFMTGHKGNPKIDAFIREVKGLVLWKPFQMCDLLDAIRSILRKSGRH